jgi:hypothetical protein
MTPPSGDLIMNHLKRIADPRRYRLRSRAADRGQAALALVLLIALLLVTGSTILATNSQEHDPLVQGDALQHYAYRALEAGIDTLINTLNEEPNLVNCSTVKKTKTCTNTANGIKFDTWVRVDNTTKTGATGAVPEWYLWTNPQFCFSSTKVTDTACASTSASGNFEFANVKVIGAAGVGPQYDYQSSVASFSPKNGFLTHVWWSNYEVSDPKLNGTNVTCTWDWKTNAYKTGGAGCTPVYFAASDHIVGPVFTNDSIYVAGTPKSSKKPAFKTPTGTHTSPVTSADPNCLFVSQTYNGPTACKTATKNVGGYTVANSHHGSSYFESPPSTDGQLATVAKQDGCLYQGPTLISFYVTNSTKQEMMNVSSPETPHSGTHDSDNTANNNNVCLSTTPIPVPAGVNASTTGLPGNGVLYVENSTPSKTSCANNHDNPFEGYLQDKETEAQIVQGTTGAYNYTDDLASVNSDCEGDVFVRDADSATGRTPGITGSITVAAQNNVVITGSLKYTDCKLADGGTWTSTKTCAYNTGSTSVNDSLGLIATNFVEVNRPAVPNCQTVHTYSKNGSLTKQCSSPTALEAACSSTVSTVTAVLCRPGATLVIDAAILALNHSFAVNNYSVRGTTGHLYVYGAIAQDWRGPVGTFSGTTLVSGYSKWYTWDSRLQYVSIPAYLTPSTPSWDLESSSVILSTSCPSPWPKPYGTTTSTITGTTPTGTVC